MMGGITWSYQPSGFIPGDHHRHLAPFGQALQAVERLDDEHLLVERVRLPRVAILGSGWFQERDRRQISRPGGLPVE